MSDDTLDPTHESQTGVLHWSQIKPQECPLNPLMLSPEGYIKEHNCLFLGQSPRHYPYQIRRVLFDRDYVISKLTKIVSPLIGDQALIKKQFGFYSHDETSKVLNRVLDDLMEPCNDSQTTQG